MAVPTTLVREAGAGPGVVCLHSNASTSGQWRGPIEALAPRYHVLAPDSYGAGQGPPWPRDRKVGLRDEVELLEPVFQRAGDPFALVGHSYGGAIALIAAIAQPQRIRCLALFEPTLLYMLGKHSPASSRGVGRLLIPVLPRVTVVEFEQMGHMGPITHPELVNDEIRRFLETS